MESNTNVKVNLTSWGFTGEDKTQVSDLCKTLNGLTFDVIQKSSQNAGKTISAQKSDITVNMQGQKINSTIWLSTDTSGKKPYANEIVEIPAIAQMYMGPELTGKEYVTIDNSDLLGSNISKNYESEIIKFLQGYIVKFDPGFNFVSRGSKIYQGQYLPEYEIKLNDGSFKNLIRYTVNNALQDKDSLNLVKELAKSMVDASGDKQAANEFNNTFSEFQKGIPDFLKEFNMTLDALREVPIVSNKGIVIDFIVDKNGNIVNESGSADFIIKPGAIEKALDGVNTGAKTMSYKEAISPTTSGTINLTLQFNTDVSSINKKIIINMPKLNKNNSISFSSLINSSGLMP